MAKKKTRRKSSKEYWAERALQTEEAVHNAAEEYNKSLAEMYEKAQRKLTDEIQYRLERMAAANGISMEEARKELSKGELAGLRDSLEEYEAKVKELLTLHPDDPRVKQLEREIETASARAHITRLEEMQYNIRLTAGTLHGEALAGMEEVNRNAYTKGLYETSKDVVGDGVKPDENEVKRVLAKPWKGENFSERVWNDRDRLVEKLHEHLSVALLTGEAPDKTAQKLADDMGVSLAAAQRIVRTESAAFAQMGTMDAYKQMGVEAYEILGTVDKRTCDTCGDLDGVRVDMKDGIQGRTLPPFHPNCRCTTVPAIEEELPDLDDIEIEGDTPFDEWLKEYGGDLGVDTEGKTGDEIVEEIRQDNERAKGEGNSPKAPSAGEDPDTWRPPKSTLGSDDVAQPKKTGYNIESEHLRRTLGADACKAIEEALDKRPEHIRKIFKHFERDLKVLGLIPNTEIYYDPDKDGVFLNLNQIINGDDYFAPGESALHEFGHMIDSLIGRELSKTGNTEDYLSVKLLTGLKDAIDTEGEKHVQNEYTILNGHLEMLKADIALGDKGAGFKTDFEWRRKNGLAFDKTGRCLTKPEDIKLFDPNYIPADISQAQAKDALAIRIFDDVNANGKRGYGSLSDIFDGILNGRIFDDLKGFGHGGKYWSEKDYNQQLEFFAEYFEASYESREQIKKNYPEAAKIAEEALIEYAKTIQE